VRVWVTGARGFVGSHLVPHLERSGCRVVAVDRDIEITDSRAVDAAIAAAQPDGIVHLAAQASVAASLDDAGASARVNYGGTLCVLRAALRRAPKARVLIISSGEIYGGADSDRPLDETTPLAPESPYATAKAAADLAAAGFAARGLAVLRIRSFNHTGPGQSDVYVASSFARQIAEIDAGRREPLLRVGNLDAVRDFLDVADVVEAYRRLLAPGVPPGAYNVASGVGRRIGALLEALLERARVRPRVEVDRALWRPARASVGDPTRLRDATGWKPQIGFDAMLDRLLDSWRARVSASP
jgi:nucleoside-diphosphate-sugar epimerase